MPDNRKSYEKCNLFLLFDFFGVNYKFTVQGDEHYRTRIGAIVTIFYFFIVVALFFGMGIDLYQRKNPRMSLNVENGPYIRTNMSNSNFTYSYRVDDKSGIWFTDNSILSFKVFYFYYEMEKGVWVSKKEHSIPNKKCNELPYYEEKEKMYKINLSSWYCLDFDNIIFGGNWGSDFVSYFQINVEMCRNSTENNNTCASKEKIASAFNNEYGSGNLFFNDNQLTVQPALNNYERPLKGALVNNFQTLSMFITKKKYTFFKLTSIDDDRGWFFEDIQKESIMNSDTINFDYILKDQWDQSVIYSSILFLGNRVETYKRSYTKIQEVFAAIGGFAKFFYFLISIGFNMILKGYKNLILINNIPFNEDALERENHKKPQLIKHIMDRKSNEIKLKEPKGMDLKNNHPDPKMIMKLPRKETTFQSEKYISYCNYIYYSFCKKKHDGNNIYSKLKRYKLYDSYFVSKLEILSYFKLHHQVNILKKILLNKDHRRLMKLIKPKLINEGEREYRQTKLDYESILSNSISYLERQNFQPLDDKTKLLINMMEKDLRHVFDHC
jgi:hypothetical protein